MDARAKWIKYEMEKKRLQQLNLDPREYQRRIGELAKRLKI